MCVTVIHIRIPHSYFKTRILSKKEKKKRRALGSFLCGCFYVAFLVVLSVGSEYCNAYGDADVID